MDTDNSVGFIIGGLGVVAAVITIIVSVAVTIRMFFSKSRKPLPLISDLNQFMGQAPGIQFRLIGKVSAKTSRLDGDVAMSLIEEYQGTERSWVTRSGLHFKGLVVEIEGGEVVLSSDEYSLTLQLGAEQTSENGHSVNGIQKANLTTIAGGKTFTATWDGERSVGTIRRLRVSVGDQIEIEGIRLGVRPASP